MARETSTRERIISSAAALFYAKGIRAVSMDAIAEKTGVTKRTLYYHFGSKDDLAAAYLAERDQPNLELFRRWFSAAEGDLACRIQEVFRNLAKAAQNRKWRGCGFLRTSAELANMPGHPAMKVAAAHKKRVEAWFSGISAEAGISEAEVLARRLMLLMDGGFATVLMHRDAAYLEAAGEAASLLVQLALRQSGEKSGPA
jgi:AcrR family transcriptional regulator